MIIIKMFSFSKFHLLFSWYNKVAAHNNWHYNHTSNAMHHKSMHHNLQLELEKHGVAAFFIPTAKYVVCASNTHITYCV